MTAPSPLVSIQGVTSVSADNLNTFEQTVDNIAQLRAFPGAPGLQVAIRGASTPGDGGYAVYWWNAGSTAPDNGTTVIVPPGSTAGAWNRLFVATTAVNQPLALADTSPTPNLIVITVPGSPANQMALQQIPLLVEIAQPNNGVTSVNANGFGYLPLVRRDFSPCIGGELLPAQHVWMIYNGAVYELIGTQPATVAEALAGTDTQSAVTPAGLIGAVRGLGFVSSNQQAFTTGSTPFIVPTGVYFLHYALVGGGGGGGATANCSSSQSDGAPGGNGGTRTQGILAVTPGGTVTVTVGAFGVGGIVGGANGQAGGTTSLVFSGTTIAAPGGHGAGNSAANTPPFVQKPPVATNVPTGGTWLDGEVSGQMGIAATTGNQIGGAGGGFGGGGASGAATSAGMNATSYGGGGGGAVTAASGAGQNGGNGGGGFAWLWW